MNCQKGVKTIIFLCIYNIVQAGPIVTDSIDTHSGPLIFYEDDPGPYGDDCWGKKRKVDHRQSLADQYITRRSRFKKAASCYEDRYESFERKVAFHEREIEKLRKKEKRYEKAIERLKGGGDVDLAELPDLDFEKMCRGRNRVGCNRKTPIDYRKRIDIVVMGIAYHIAQAEESRGAVSYYEGRFDSMDVENNLAFYERMIDRFEETASDIAMAGVSRCERGDGEIVDCVYIKRNEGSFEFYEVDLED